jgi:hypothetical protein
MNGSGFGEGDKFLDDDDEVGGGESYGALSTVMDSCCCGLISL